MLFGRNFQIIREQILRVQPIPWYFEEGNHIKFYHRIIISRFRSSINNFNYEITEVKYSTSTRSYDKNMEVEL